MAPLVLVAALTMSGCYAMDIDTTGLDPTVYLNREGAVEMERVASFEADTRASWLLWGLVDLGDPDVGEIVRHEVRRENGTAVVDVEIATQTTFMDGFISALTLGLYGQRTTFVRGTVVR
jgi:hypothetical protein